MLNPIVLPLPQYIQTAAMLFQSGVCSGHTLPGEPQYLSKESHFFDNVDRYKKGLEFYSQRYQHCDSTNQLIMDATPAHFLFAERVNEFYSQPGLEEYRKKLKLILIIREPISREISLYNHKIVEFTKDPNPSNWFADVARKDGSIRSLDEHMYEIVKPTITNPRKKRGRDSIYVDFLADWFENFPRDQLLILSKAEFDENSDSFKQRLETFLGQSFTKDFHRVNAKKGKGSLESRLLNCETERMLSDIFEPKNQKLYELLKANPGPSMEQTPFPSFKRSGDCNS